MKKSTIKLNNMGAYILGLAEINRTMIAEVGGKAAHLGELCRMEGLPVPAGFCVSTEAYREIICTSKIYHSLLDQLAILTADNRKEIAEISEKIRSVIKQIDIPENICNEISRHLEQLGEGTACAVRSSATAEDLPAASFAGQQDTYLNVIGKKGILENIINCWSSLFTERAVIYRLQNGFDHRKVYLSVIIQKMIFPDAAGIMFTADPVTSNRKLLSIDASFGLGEAMVSGLVNADLYKVNNEKIVEKKISSKKLAVGAVEAGGTNVQEIETEKQNRQALTDEQILQLADTGRKIEAHFGHPQDIEWCLADDTFYIVQSRPITALFPVPETTDQENHVYISVGHQQMMTDAMKPLGLSCWLLMTPAFMRVAGGRLFVDVAPMLAWPAGRKTMIDVLGKFDPLIRDALTNIVEREGFIKWSPGSNQQDDKKGPDAGKLNTAAPMPDYGALNEYDPNIVADLIRSNQAAVALLKQNIQLKSGPELFDFILEDMQQLKKTNTDPQSFAVIMTGMNAASWINEKMYEWLDEKNAADTLAQSLPNNITSEMGLALLDVADIIRPYPELVNYLNRSIEIKDEDFLDKLIQFNGGRETREAIGNYLNKYGMRCSGEIDITKPRWVERPITLVPLILGNIKNFRPGAGHRKFEQGLQEALKKERDLLDRLKQLPDGEQKCKETKRMINLVRNYAGYREYPKYGIVSRYLVYKQALLKEAGKLVQTGVLHEKEDVYYLSFEEFRAIVHTNKIDYQVISKRKEDFKLYEKLTPPRVLTSDGEIITGKYNRENLPAGAIAGLAVSTGVIEGRARVIVNMETASLEEGDILVTCFTDPSWTALFVCIKGLVTEVGGLMTHGAVIAREYGLPAVVGVENATKLIKDGQRIRVNGTDGYVELL